MLNLMPKIFIKRLIRKLKNYNEIAEIDEIARRYFALNSFDGILTTLGIIVASYFAGITSIRIIVTACIGAAIAVAISGFYGAYTTESAEREGKMKTLEKNIGFTLRDSPIKHANTFAVIVLAIIEGFMPFLMAISIIIPFFVMENIFNAYYSALALSLFFLFVIGAFLGRVSKRSMALSGVKMIAAGITCIVILYFVDSFFKI